jgi:hypothetical protein
MNGNLMLVEWTQLALDTFLSSNLTSFVPVAGPPTFSRLEVPSLIGLSAISIHLASSRPGDRRTFRVPHTRRAHPGRAWIATRSPAAWAGVVAIRLPYRHYLRAHRNKSCDRHRWPSHKSHS